MSTAEDFEEALHRFRHSAVCMVSTHRDLLKARQPPGGDRNLIAQLQRATMDCWTEARDWMAKVCVLSFAPSHDLAGMTPRQWSGSTCSDVKEATALLNKRIGKGSRWPRVTKHDEVRLRALLRRLDTRTQEVRGLEASDVVHAPAGR